MNNGKSAILLKLILSIIVFSQLFLFYSLTHCCSCILPPPPIVAMARSDYVISGQVIDFEAPDPRPSIYNGEIVMSCSSADMVRWRIAVLCTWKGSIQDTIDVYSSRDEESCGFPFEVGQKYLIYARIVEKVEYIWIRLRWPRDIALPVIVTGFCTRTKLLEEAAEDIAELPDVFYKH